MLEIDPAVGGAAQANAISAKSLATLLKAEELSVADLFAANGFANFTTKDLIGKVGKPNGAATAGAGAGRENGDDAGAAAPASTDASAADAEAACASTAVVTSTVVVTSTMMV